LAALYGSIVSNSNSSVEKRPKVLSFLLSLINLGLNKPPATGSSNPREQSKEQLANLLKKLNQGQKKRQPTDEDGQPKICKI